MSELEMDKVTRHRCPACNTWMDVKFDPLTLNIEGVEVVLKEIPLMCCPQCEAFRLPDRAKQLVAYFVDEAKKNKKSRVELMPTGVLAKRYPYGEVEFVYSALDHDFIPGLARPWNDGFLTPVFFRAAVLNKYAQDPSYKLDLFSDTYGSLIKGDEINIQFGINRSGKVIMWLGDIAELPEAEQYYLRSENVESDHDVCSEFYDAQIECVFSEPSIESRVIRARAELNEGCKSKFADELYQLPTEIGRVVENLHRPLFWEEKHVAQVAESFNRVIVESLNVAMVRKQLEAHVSKDDLKGLKGLKLMEAWLTKGLGSKDGKTLMLPFFVLYDFRVLTCHLASDESREKVLTSINERLGLEKTNAKLDTIYFALLPKITASLEAIRAIVG